MVKVKKKYFIGQGEFQRCYIHPKNETKCVKTKRKDKTHKEDRVKREIKYYKKIQKKNLKTDVFWAKYRGKVKTNKGKGHVFDLIRDETTNAISLTLKDYLLMENCPFSDEYLNSKLDELKDRMIVNKILIKDLYGENICCKILKDGTLELIVIDGVGHRDFLPLVDWFSFFAKRKIERLFAKRKMNSIEQHRNMYLRRK